jgi:hypothetical protein
MRLLGSGLCDYSSILGKGKYTLSLLQNITTRLSGPRVLMFNGSEDIFLEVKWIKNDWINVSTSAMCLYSSYRNNLTFKFKLP